MPVEDFFGSVEPENAQAQLWRFVSLEKFCDLIETSELYFSRADLFKDQDEGLAPEPFIPLIDPNDPIGITNAQGSQAQFREGFFVSCWHLFSGETAGMWTEYGKTGVALCSRFDLLKQAMNELEDRIFLSVVRYYPNPLIATGRNTVRLILTKRNEYAHEKEVRAVIWMPDKYAGINRHIDENNIPRARPLTPPPDRVPRFLRRRVSLSSLLTGVVVSPYAPDSVLAAAEQKMRDGGYSITVEHSPMAKYRDLLL